jgi:hypothetical protein
MPEQGPVEQLECSPPCQGGGRGFKSRQDRSADAAPIARRRRSRPGSSVGTSVRLKIGRSAVRPRPWPPSLAGLQQSPPAKTLVGTSLFRASLRSSRIDRVTSSRHGGRRGQAAYDQFVAPRRLRRRALVRVVLIPCLCTATTAATIATNFSARPTSFQVAATAVSLVLTMALASTSEWLAWADKTKIHLKKTL